MYSQTPLVLFIEWQQSTNIEFVFKCNIYLFMYTGVNQPPILYTLYTLAQQQYDATKLHLIFYTIGCFFYLKPFT